MANLARVVALLATLAVAGCGTYGAGVNTPIGGASAGVTLGQPAPYAPSYLR
jgi:hypothetical protein